MIVYPPSLKPIQCRWTIWRSAWSSYVCRGLAKQTVSLRWIQYSIRDPGLQREDIWREEIMDNVDGDGVQITDSYATCCMRKSSLLGCPTVCQHRPPQSSPDTSSLRCSWIGKTSTLYVMLRPRSWHDEVSWMPTRLLKKGRWYSHTLDLWTSAWQSLSAFLMIQSSRNCSSTARGPHATTVEAVATVQGTLALLSVSGLEFGVKVSHTTWKQPISPNFEALSNSTAQYPFSTCMEELCRWFWVQGTVVVWFSMYWKKMKPVKWGTSPMRIIEATFLCHCSPCLRYGGQ